MLGMFARDGTRKSRCGGQACPDRVSCPTPVQLINEAAGGVLVTARHLLTGFSSSDVHRSRTCFEMIVPRPWGLRYDQSTDHRARRLRPNLGGGIRRLEAQAATTSPDRRD